jgi:acyl-CoA dehydrogenase
MKHQTTERARTILNHGMDIYSGSAICTGENNFFTKFYNASPVGITVEGSNTLTRGLIIYGQGLNKSHPYIFPIFQSIQDDDLDAFKTNFNKMLKEIVINYIKVLNPISLSNKTTSQTRLDKATLKFSLLSNFVALLGGKIKAKQMISGNMADILSNLYLGYSVMWYHNHFCNGSTIRLRNESLDYLMNELEYKMNLVIDNYPIAIVKPLLYPLKSQIVYANLEKKNDLYKVILNNEELHNTFKNDIYYKGTVLEKMEALRKMEPNSLEYNYLYQEIIQVGEYPIKN